MKKIKNKPIFLLVAFLLFPACSYLYLLNIKGKRILLITYLETKSEICDELSYFRLLQNMFSKEHPKMHMNHLQQFKLICPSLKEISYIDLKNQREYKSSSSTFLPLNNTSFAKKDWIAIFYSEESRSYQGMLFTDIRDKNGNVLGYLKGIYELVYTSKVVESLYKLGIKLSFEEKKTGVIHHHIPFADRIYLCWHKASYTFL